jgi:hypothetical protein
MDKSCLLIGVKFMDHRTSTGKLRVLLAACVLLLSSLLGIQPATAAPTFAVLAFYSNVDDQAHNSYVKEANLWFPKAGTQYNFSYESTTNWERLSSITAAQYQVVLFLDDLPHSSASQAGFQRYMQNGGAYFGFHVSAFTTSASSWDWYFNQFLGSGNFVSNTWFPTTAVLKVEDHTQPATRRLPATYVSGISEWYSWSKDLRTNANIRILASVDPSSFPLGTDPNQSWYSGYYPIMWSNRNYKMIYANFGHNAMNYGANVGTSSTFADLAQNEFIIDGLLALGGAPPSDAPTDPVDPAGWFTVVNASNGKCVDARGAATANGTVVQQYACNQTQAQQYQFQTVGGPYLRINNRANPTQSLDVTNRSTGDNAGIQLWAYSDGTNQQWQPVLEGGDQYRLVNRNSTKCLTAPSSADGAQLTQATCTGSSSQSFHLVRV